MEDISSVVIDSGTGMIKASFLGEDAPHSLFPSVTAKSKILKRKKGLEVKDSYVGNDAQNQREFMDLVYPIERGMIMDWDSMLKVWKFVFHELQTDVDGTTPVMCWLCFHQ